MSGSEAACHRELAIRLGVMPDPAPVSGNADLRRGRVVPLVIAVIGGFICVGVDGEERPQDFLRRKARE